MKDSRSTPEKRKRRCSANLLGFSHFVHGSSRDFEASIVDAHNGDYGHYKASKSDCKEVMKMQFEKIPLKESTRMRLQAHRVFPKKEIAEEQGLVLLGEVMLKELYGVWRQLFRGGELKNLAMSKKEVMEWSMREMTGKKGDQGPWAAGY